MQFPDCHKKGINCPKKGIIEQAIQLDFVLGKGIASCYQMLCAVCCWLHTHEVNIFMHIEVHLKFMIYAKLLFNSKNKANTCTVN